MSLLRRYCSDEKGTTAIEYALIGTLISIIIVTSVTLVGTRISGKFLGPIAGSLT